MINNYVEEIIALLQDGDGAEIHDNIMEFHPYEVSEALLEMSEQQRATFYSIFSAEDVSLIFSYLDIEDALELLEFAFGLN